MALPSIVEKCIARNCDKIGDLEPERGQHQEAIRMKKYAVVKIFTRYGTLFSILVAVLVSGCGLLAYYQGNIGPVWLVMSFAAALVGAFLTLLLVDLTKLISEMLIPQ